MFLSLATFFYFISYCVFLSAAPDVVPGLAGVDLLANVIPSVIVELVVPWFIHHLSYGLRVLIVTSCAVTSFYIVGLAQGSPEIQVCLLVWPFFLSQYANLVQ